MGDWDGRLGDWGDWGDGEMGRWGDLHSVLAHLGSEGFEADLQAIGGSRGIAVGLLKGAGDRFTLDRFGGAPHDIGERSR
jgi:hypothetical protein